MNVLKFGGSSLQNQYMQNTVINIIKDHWKNDLATAVVFSAFGKSTNRLISMAEKASLKDSSYTDELKDFYQFHIECYQFLISKNQTNFYLHQLYQDLSDILRGVYLIGELSLRTKDLIMSFGERYSNWIRVRCRS